MPKPSKADPLRAPVSKRPRSMVLPPLDPAAFLDGKIRRYEQLPLPYEDETYGAEYRDTRGLAFIGRAGRMYMVSVQPFAVVEARTAEQLPSLTHTTLGGCPNRRARCWKSLSFDTITSPCAASSVAVLPKKRPAVAAPEEQRRDPRAKVDPGLTPVGKRRA